MHRGPLASLTSPTVLPSTDITHSIWALPGENVIDWLTLPLFLSTNYSSWGLWAVDWVKISQSNWGMLSGATPVERSRRKEKQTEGEVELVAGPKKASANITCGGFIQAKQSPQKNWQLRANFYHLFQQLKRDLGRERQSTTLAHSKVVEGSNRM